MGLNGNPTLNIRNKTKKQQLNSEQCDFQNGDVLIHPLWSLLVGGGFCASLWWGPSLAVRENPQILELSNILCLLQNTPSVGLTDL